jgi:NAD(P)-dependent dehydrogenase (short-subunit alcohol dehydrogenase family)
LAIEILDFWPADCHSKRGPAALTDRARCLDLQEAVSIALKCSRWCGAISKSGLRWARIPLGGFGKVVELVELMLFLAWPAFNLITGRSIFADGGYTAI